ncbi:SDR family NAD(P)-dependent oxidoreductase [Rhizorhabdus histidinilytica]|uniref:SDR family NAD(P)-dependent oxidoreductase n=1 Tax=Rhizorhabdus histidinilytica TaxID=439228 RepID=UPI003220284D
MTRTAIVTGAANGIGTAIASALVRKGYRVGLLDLDAQAVEARTAEIGEGAVALAADVSDPAAVARAFDGFGDAPDLVVNNAGIVRFGPLAEQEVTDFEAVLRINLLGAYIVTREAVRRMVGRGSGHVISITSTNAYNPGPGSGAYPASKIALLQLMKQFALEYGEAGLRFNSIAPGFIDGGMSTPIYADPKVRAARSGGVPLKRLGVPEDIAHAVLMLDAEGSSYITGIDLLVDGGVTHAVLKNLPRD